MSRKIVLIIAIFLMIFSGKKIIEAKKVQESKEIKRIIKKENVVSNKDKDELLTLVNYENEVPDNWQVDIVTLKNGQSIDRRAYQELCQMLEDAKKEGMDLLICSSYRTVDKQKELFNNKVKYYLKRGYSRAEANNSASYWVAKPNTCEHQLGLAVDIVSHHNQRLDSSQEKTKEQRWLMENCYRYGFILRYPNNKSEITKIGYEPWHYRYVGKEHAKKIMEQNICLEEYLKE